MNKVNFVLPFPKAMSYKKLLFKYPNPVSLISLLIASWLVVSYKYTAREEETGTTMCEVRRACFSLAEISRFTVPVFSLCSNAIIAKLD